MAREINLVPDIKNEMIRTLKLRNFIFFLCIIVSSISIGVTLIAGLAVGGQELAIEGKKNAIDELSQKVNSFSDLSDYLTIKDQLSDISALTDDRKVFSRTFDILSAILPTGADTIKISELNVDLSGEDPTFTFDAQANAGQEPFIDYNVLDSFKKSMEYMHYDYGDYVDSYGQTIPAYCMIESSDDGATFKDENNNYYAFWTIEAEGCNPSAVNNSTTNTVPANTEDYNGVKVVRIWRTPQYDEWYQKGYMTLDGSISGVEHFDSSCISYSGTKNSNGGTVKWAENSNSCNLVPDGTNGISIADGSSNGRDASGELVLRFTATITFDSNFYMFNNHHMIAIAPSGRRNVTDSYKQVQAMFGERASDCAADDAACRASNNTDSNANSNTNSSTNGGRQ